MQDFPAAHSMDTDWFAIDADGHIGIFVSDEGGAVPQTNDHLFVESQEKDPVYPNNIFYEWAKESENCIIDYNITSEQILQSIGIDLLELKKTSRGSLGSRLLRSSIDPTSIHEQEKSIQAWKYPGTHWLLFPNGNELSMLTMLKNDGWKSENYVIRFRSQPLMLFVSHAPITTIQMLFKKGYLNYYLMLKSRSLFYDNNLLTLLGIFSYSNDNDNDNYPYEMDGKPPAPLKLSDLPERLQNSLSWNWFENIKFADSKRIQPIEHMKCKTWQNNKWWMDTQNNGHEEHPYK